METISDSGNHHPFLDIWNPWRSSAADTTNSTAAISIICSYYIYILCTSGAADNFFPLFSDKQQMLNNLPLKIWPMTTTTNPGQRAIYGWWLLVNVLCVPHAWVRCRQLVYDKFYFAYKNALGASRSAIVERTLIVRAQDKSWYRQRLLRWKG